MIIARLGWAKRSRRPAFKVLDHSFGPLTMFRVWRSTMSFTLKDMGSYAIVDTGRYTLKLNRRKAGLMISEWGLWNRHYLPEGGVGGQTILEVGAGCGESAALLFEKGAKKVVCVEPVPEEVAFLRENVKENHWDAEVVPKEFDLSLLSGQFDLVRMDCEGCEASLLSLDELPRIIAEVHTKELRDAFLARGLKETWRLGQDTWIMSNTGDSAHATTLNIQH